MHRSAIYIFFNHPSSNFVGMRKRLCGTGSSYICLYICHFLLSNILLKGISLYMYIIIIRSATHNHKNYYHVTLLSIILYRTP